MLAYRLHSDFSLLKSMVPIEAYPEALIARGYDSAVLADFDCGFGWVDFYFKMKAKKLKPILGSHLQLSLQKGSKLKGGVSLIVTQAQGYRNLCKILSANSFGQLDIEKLLSCREGLLSVFSADHPHLETDFFDSFMEDWGRSNIYFEIGAYDSAPNSTAVEALGSQKRIQCIPAQSVYYLQEQDHLAHEVLMSIGAGTTLQDDQRPILASKDFFLKSADEIQSMFCDRREYLENLNQMADRCDFQFETDSYHLPSFGPEDEVNELFAQKCREGLRERLDLLRSSSDSEFSDQVEAVYTARLEEEIRIIQSMNFPGYFLIVADFIQWSKSNDIPVGPGRGSGAGSLAAYCLKITDIDPIRYNLLFERFLNPERVSLPDFDIDFCIKGRDRVIQYVREKYNLKGEAPEEERSKVAQIITYGKMKSKAVIRDVGRALGMPYSDVDAIARLIPNVLNINLQEAFEKEPEFENLRQRDPKANELLKIAEQLEGLNRHSSVHAAGVVIADEVLTNYLPLLKGADSEIVCQYEMKAVEKIGLVKFDFLGLRNLTVIQEAIRLSGKKIELLKIDYNDPKVMKEISTGETVGVFQLESSGMRDVIRRLQPSVFEDLIAIVALYRPGPLEGGMVDDFILRKRGQKSITYPHSVLEPILKETYGVFVYQEQVMKTANVMASFNLGEADLLRRAMGKKIAEEMAQQREKFVKGAVLNQYPESLAQSIFDLMSEFAKYGFNKSHAAAYAMITFQTAFLKTYYPEAFFAALLSSESEDVEKMGAIIRTASKRGVIVKPPHVNHSEESFALETFDEKLAVRFGLSAIKNLGQNVAQSIVQERHRNGAFKSIEDFFNRAAPVLGNRRQAECLIRSGALDSMGYSRSSIFSSLDNLTGEAQASERARQTGQGSLFKRQMKLKLTEEWPDKIRLNDEKHLLGTYISGHPLESMSALIKALKTKNIGDLLEEPVPAREKEIQIVGMITSSKEIFTKKGNKMAFFTLEDLEAQIEVVSFSDLYQKKSDLIVNDRVVLVRGQLVREEGVTRLLARDVNDVALAQFSEIHVCLEDRSKIDKLEKLIEVGSKFVGDIPLKVRIPADPVVSGTALKQSFVMIETALQVQTHPEFLSWVETSFGEGSVRLI